MGKALARVGIKSEPRLNLAGVWALRMSWALGETPSVPGETPSP